jgi:asparagine synthase (glutamine-hydrolysing)
MCGIAGFVGEGTAADLARMNDVIAHRGPDGEGYWHDNTKNLHLAHRRLAIVDIEGGVQPMATPEGDLVVVFNGEIYNAPELRAELSARGARFLSHHSDTEVLLHGYRAWGGELPEKLNGMWAFALYDIAGARLFLSRDRFGKKPLYYHHRPGLFVFASELTALLTHPLVAPSLSPTALRKYFAYGFIPAPWSLYEGVFKVPAGFSLALSLPDGSLSLKKYWDFFLEPFETVPKDPEHSWGEELRALLEQAVRRRLMADVPLGVFLSGGIDSSSVTAYAAKLAGANRLKTFSIGFDEATFDESAYASSAASFYGTEHHMERVSLENAKTLLPAIMKKLDEPMGDSSLIPTYLLCGATRAHVTVALGGDGADELFAGYAPFRALRAAGAYDRLVPRPLHKALIHLAFLLPMAHTYMSLDFKIKKTLQGLSYPEKVRHAVWLGPLCPPELCDLFASPCDLEEIYSEAIALWEEGQRLDPVDQALQFYTKLYLQDDILTKVDRASMMHSLEVRTPYLDIDLVNFVRRIPHRYKFRHGQTKYILKKALQGVVPGEILHRSKQGFAVPVGKWFAHGALDFPAASPTPLLNDEAAARFYRCHREHRRDYRLFLWNYWLLDRYLHQRNESPA